MPTNKETKVAGALRHVRAAFQCKGVIDVLQDSGAEIRNALGLRTVHQETVKETVDELVKRDELIKKAVVVESANGRRRGVRYLVNARKFTRV